MVSHNPSKIPIVILAGGQGSRMGGLDKCLLSIGTQNILDRLITTLAPQTRTLVLNANGDPSRFQPYNLPVIKDLYDTPIGPLGGLSSALDQIAHDTEWIMTVAGDCPFIPEDLLTILSTHADNKTQVVFCHSNDRDHYVNALWSISIKQRLTQFLDQGERSVGKFIRGLNAKIVHFDTDPIDPFFNINTNAQWHIAERDVEKKTQ